MNVIQIQSDLSKMQALLMGWEALKTEHPDQAETLVYQALDLTEEVIADFIT